MSERYEKGREPVTYQSPSDSLIAYVLEHNPDFISFKDLCSLYFREKKVLKSLILQKKKSERKDSCVTYSNIDQLIEEKKRLIDIISREFRNRANLSSSAYKEILCGITISLFFTFLVYFVCYIFVIDDSPDGLTDSFVAFLNLINSCVAKLVAFIIYSGECVRKVFDIVTIEGIIIVIALFISIFILWLIFYIYNLFITNNIRKLQSLAAVIFLIISFVVSYFTSYYLLLDFNDPSYPNGDITVFITLTGEKYHKSSCSYLRSSSIDISLQKANNWGYDPCSRCDPPDFISEEEYLHRRSEQSIILFLILSIIFAFGLSFCYFMLLACINDIFHFINHFPDWFSLWYLIVVFVAVFIQSLRTFIIW